jgi:outer membrane protein assembly factor BamB
VIRRALIALVVLSGCGPSGPFRLTGGDNDPGALEVALNARAPVSGEIVNASAAPISVIASDSELALVELATGKTRWKVPAKVASRVAVGGDFAVALEGKELVGRDLATGQVRWRSGGSGELLGVAADRTGVYATWKSGKTWRVVALAGSSGSERWSAESSGRVGAPAAGRGLVLVPFLSQWLALLDAGSGELETRVRGIDEEISFAHTDARDAYFGSDRGVFLLDARAASGRRDQATYGAVTLPEVFSDLAFAADAYDPGQAGYGARDRRRILWHGSARGADLEFDHGAVVLHWFRYLFAIDPASAELRWAYSHPRIDLVKVAHLGTAIAAVVADGSVIALDPKTGATVGKPIAVKLAGGAIGATFDADGWTPPGAAGEPPSLAAVLGGIASDRDARFALIKGYAVSALAGVAEPRATAELLEIANGGGALAEAAAQALVKRADPAAVPMLLSRLAARYDHVAGTRPACVQICSLALAGMPIDAVPVSDRPALIRSLLAHFDSPATGAEALEAVTLALARHGAAGAQSRFREFLRLYRADPEIAEMPLMVRSMAAAVAASGKAGIEVLESVAAAANTEPAIAAEVQQAIDAVKQPPAEPAPGPEPEPSE